MKRLLVIVLTLLVLAAIVPTMGLAVIAVTRSETNTFVSGETGKDCSSATPGSEHLQNYVFFHDIEYVAADIHTVVATAYAQDKSSEVIEIYLCRIDRTGTPKYIASSDDNSSHALYTSATLSLEFAIASTSSDYAIVLKGGAVGQYTLLLTSDPLFSATTGGGSSCGSGFCPGDGLERHSTLAEIGVIYPWSAEGFGFAIWEVDLNSNGHFQLAISQATIDAAAPGLVAASADGRVAVHRWDDGNVTISIGPNYDGKVFHTTYSGGINGPIIGTSTTIGGPPGG